MKEPKLRFTEFSNSLKQRNLSDITSKIGSGKTPHGGRKIYVSSGIPLIRSQNVNNDKVNFDDVVFIDEATDESMKNSRVMTNDVLLNITGASIGRSAVYKNEANANVNQHVCIIRLIKEYSPNFLQLCLTSNRGQKQIDYSQAGGGREGLNFQAIGEMNFMFPSIEEQQKIGFLFTKLDVLIQSAEKELDGYRELKQGMLQKMFPKKDEKVPEIRFPEFTGDWEQRKVGDICKTYSGGTPKSGKSSYYDNGTIPFIRSGEIHNDRTELYITEDGMNESSAKMVDVGDILYALYGATSGEVDISKINGAINQAILCIKPTTDFDRKFIVEILRHNKESILRTYLQGGQGNLSAQIIQSQIFDFPCLAEQQRIGEYFSNLDNLITIQQKELDGYKELKKGLLQQMFC